MYKNNYQNRFEKAKQIKIKDTLQNNLSVLSTASNMHKIPIDKMFKQYPKAMALCSLYDHTGYQNLVFKRFKRHITAPNGCYPIDDKDIHIATGTPAKDQIKYADLSDVFKNSIKNQINELDGFTLEAIIKSNQKEIAPQNVNASIKQSIPDPLKKE